jgi:hypothetical protein
MSAPMEAPQLHCMASHWLAHAVVLLHYLQDSLSKRMTLTASSTRYFTQEGFCVRLFLAEKFRQRTRNIVHPRIEKIRKTVPFSKNHVKFLALDFRVLRHSSRTCDKARIRYKNDVKRHRKEITAHTSLELLQQYCT